MNNNSKMILRFAADTRNNSVSLHDRRLSVDIPLRHK